MSFTSFCSYTVHWSFLYVHVVFYYSATQCRTLKSVNNSICFPLFMVCTGRNNIFLLLFSLIHHIAAVADCSYLLEECLLSLSSHIIKKKQKQYVVKRDSFRGRWGSCSIFKNTTRLFCCSWPLWNSFGYSDDCSKCVLKVTVSRRFGSDLSCLIRTKLRTSETKKILVPIAVSPPDWAKVNSVSNEYGNLKENCSNIHNCEIICYKSPIFLF